MEIIQNVVFNAWSWVPWVLGLGTVGWIALALLAPGLLSVVSPLLKGAAEGLVEFVKVLYEGTTDILDSWKTVVTVAVLIAVVGNYWSFSERKPLHKEPIAKVLKGKTAKQTPRDETELPFSWVR